METTKMYLRPGEKARLEIVLMIAVVMASIKWTTQSGIVALDRSEQNTPLDMAIIATGQPGIAYIEFEAEVAHQNRKIRHTFEIHNVQGETSEDFDAFARLRRSYRRNHEQQSDQRATSADANASANLSRDVSETTSGENKTTAEQDRSMMRMGSDNDLMKEGAPAKPAETNSEIIEPLPINDTTTTSLGGTIGSPAFGSGAKPTGTVVGIDTIQSDLSVADPLAEAEEENKTSEQKEKEREDQKFLDESLKKAAAVDEHLKEEAKKLPSETELSGEPQNVVVRPTETVAEDDSRRDAPSDQQSEVSENGEVSGASDAKETAQDSDKADSAKKPTDATPKTATKKPAKPTPKAKKSDK